MIRNEIENLLEAHRLWLKDKTTIKEIGANWVEITTPYLDRHNDCLQIYARQDGNGFELTDDGYIITDLLNSGCSLDAPRRRELLKTTLAGFGVQLHDDVLTTRAARDNFPVKKHNIVQAMLAVNDLFYLASPHIESLFFEDVVKWLDLSAIRYTQKVKFAGKSGYDHQFDFVVPKSSVRPERIIQTLSNPKKDGAESLIYRWSDTRELRADDEQLFVLLNDSNEVSVGVIEAFKNYDIKPVLWSNREQAKNELAA